MLNIQYKIFNKIDETVILSPDTDNIFCLGNTYDVVIENTISYEDACKMIFDFEDKHDKIINNIVIMPAKNTELYTTTALYESLCDYFDDEVTLSISCDNQNHDPFNVIINCLNSVYTSSQNANNGIILDERVMSYFWYALPIFRTYCHWVNGFIIESDRSAVTEFLKDKSKLQMKHNLLVIQ